MRIRLIPDFHQQSCVLEDTRVLHSNSRGKWLSTWKLLYLGNWQVRGPNIDIFGHERIRKLRAHVSFKYYFNKMKKKRTAWVIRAAKTWNFRKWKYKYSSQNSCWSLGAQTPDTAIALPLVIRSGWEHFLLCIYTLLCYLHLFLFWI